VKVSFLYGWTPLGVPVAVVRKNPSHKSALTWTLFTLNDSLDVRGKPFSSARHWSSSQLFGTRAHFRTVTDPARLVIENVKLTDEGVYRCRVDFRNSPTRNFRFNLTVLGMTSNFTLFLHSHLFSHPSIIRTKNI